MKTQTSNRSAVIVPAHPAQIPASHTFRNFGGYPAECIGICPVSRIRLYVADEEAHPNSSNDPRGPLGEHAAAYFVASEYSMKGPTLAVSWIAINNNREFYNRALALAKTAWEDDPEAARAAAEQIERANAYHAKRNA